MNNAVTYSSAENQCNGWLFVLHTHVRQGWMLLAVTSALAYYDTKSMMSWKCFYSKLYVTLNASKHFEMFNKNFINFTFLQIYSAITIKMGATTISIMTFSITTHSIKGLFGTHIINGTQHSNNQYRVPLRWVLHFIYCYAECRYAECHYA
jgi:hypothetical protein